MNPSQTINSIRTQSAQATVPKKRRLSYQDQATMVIGMFVGVFFNQFVMQAQGTNFSPEINIDLIQTVVYFVITIAMTPFVYEKINIDPEADFIYKFGIYVLTGLFFPTIMNEITTIICASK